MKLTGGSNLGYQVAFNCAISQAFVCAVYVLFAVNERQTGAKHMQQIAGVKPLAYWGASLLWDWISYLTVIFSILIMLYYHGDPGYSSWKQMGQCDIITCYYNVLRGYYVPTKCNWVLYNIHSNIKKNSNINYRIFYFGS